MPFTPLVDLDPIKLADTSQRLCNIFGVPSIRRFQEQAGINMLQGRTTILDIPTGGGKTLAFWYPLFYHWTPGDTRKESQKIVLVIGPLTGLMESQAQGLRNKGIPAVAITSNTPNRSEVMKQFGANKFRVGFVGPETALSSEFQTSVLSKKAFTDNIIMLVIDEAHTVSEWGTDDFRPDYARSGTMRGRLPGGTPILVASATMPRDIILDLQHKLGLTDNCARIAISNEKPNVAISVRQMQHPADTFADLLPLIPLDAVVPQDFPQTIFYVNGRQDAEKIQDFLREHAPATFPPEAFEFYHRAIDEERKQVIQDRLNDGTIRGAPSTEALGLKHHIDQDSTAEDEEIPDLENASDEDLQVDSGATRDQATDSDTASIQATGRGPQKSKGQKAVSALQARDMKYLRDFLVTNGCRRIPWNKFFDNDNKIKLDLPPLPADARCCDNCTPDLFPVETVAMTGGRKLKSGRRAKPSEEMYDAIYNRLSDLRDDIVSRDWGVQHFLTGRSILQDDILDTLASRASSIDTLDTLRENVDWFWSFKYGEEVILAMKDVLADFPDAVNTSRDQDAADRAIRVADRVTAKDLHLRMVAAFDHCYAKVLEETFVDNRGKTKRICQPFMRIPNKQAYPEYYQLIDKPISMAHINQSSHKANHYSSVVEYSNDWHLMFDNARLFNDPDSQIYDDANYLQQVLDETLLTVSVGLPGSENLPSVISDNEDVGAELQSD